jgi:hypothetical protein
MYNFISLNLNYKFRIIPIVYYENSIYQININNNNLLSNIPITNPENTQFMIELIDILHTN